MSEGKNTPEDISENAEENIEATEIDDKTDGAIEQNYEDDKSENEELQNLNDDTDLISEKGTLDEPMEDHELFQDGLKPRRDKIETLELFEIEETDLRKDETEEEYQKELGSFGAPENEEDSSEEEDQEGGDNKEEKETITSSAIIEDKDSVFTRGRGSISYDMGPRIRDVEDNQIVTGDFLIPQEDIPLKFYKYMDEKEEEEEHRESIHEEEEVEIDRAPYYEKYESLTTEITAEKLKSNILQKKLAKFFKRRKMDHVLKETDQQFDTQEKYGKKLDAYGELSNLDFVQRTTITNELDNLKLERESKCYELNKMFEALQIQEKDTGYGLIHTKTGKPIPDKLVERLLQRQKHQMQTVGDMRLKYIQLKNMVAEKQNAISQLDKIGENLYLMDYEQLKVENRSYMDKMEEKDEELSRLRNKCQKTIQILAHMREKSAALESDIYDLTDDLQNLNQNSMAVRGNLNKLKQQRDYFRNMTNKLRDESGLLTQSELLRDMEVSMEELKLMTKELEFLKEEHKVKAQQIRNIRKNIEFPPEGLIKRTQKVVSDKAAHGRHLYIGRPSLHKPNIPEDAYRHLRNFKGKPTFGKQEKK